MSNRGINWARSLKGSGGYKNVLAAMGDAANQYMATWTGREKLAELTGLTKETVRDHQNKAVANGDLILVPWQTNSGADASPAYFLGCVTEVFDEMPPFELAFAKRINFKGPGKGGRPRDFKPSWWSGEKIGGGHRCTCCGNICHGADPLGQGDEGAPEGHPEPVTEPSVSKGSDPGEGGGFPTLEGRFFTTLPGGDFPDPFNPKEDNPKDVSPKSGAPSEALARPLPVKERVELSLGGGSGGRVETDAADPAADPRRLPAGHGAKAAPREREISSQRSESAPPLRLSPEEKRQREQGAIEAAIAALESTLGLEGATRVIRASLAALERADEAVAQSAHREALEAIVPPGWTGAGTTRRYDADVAARALTVALGARLLARWPRAVLEPLGLGAERVAAA